MGHLIVTRFAVPHEKGATAHLHYDRAWLDGRLDLFRRFFVPSVGPSGVPVILLCGRRAAEYVAGRVADLAWARVEVVEEWRGGWSEPGSTLTRMDSDDALHRGWFDAVDRVPAEAEVCFTRTFLRLDLPTGRVYEYRRREPSPLAAFRNGINPYAQDHLFLERHFRTHAIEGAWLLQVAHGGNLSNHRPLPWRIDRLTSRSRLEDFRIDPSQTAPTTRFGLLGPRRAKQ